MEHSSNNLPAGGGRGGSPFRQPSKSVPLLETRQVRSSGGPPQGPQRVRKQRRSANLMTDYFVTGKRTPDEARTPAARLSQALTRPRSLPLPLVPSFTSCLLFSLSPFSFSYTYVPYQNFSLMHLTCTFAICLARIITVRKL